MSFFVGQATVNLGQVLLYGNMILQLLCRVEIILKHVTSIDHQSEEFDRRWKSMQRSSADLPLLVDLQIEARIRLLPYCRDKPAPLSV